MSAETLAIVATCVVAAVVCAGVAAAVVQVLLIAVRLRTPSPAGPVRATPDVDDVADACDRAFGKTAWSRIGGGH